MMEMNMTLKLTNKSRVAIIKLFGPNKRNVAAAMINNSKKNDIKFVETLAIDVIKQCH